MNKIIQSTKNRVHNFYAIEKSPVKRTYEIQQNANAKFPIYDDTCVFVKLKLDLCQIYPCYRFLRCLNFHCSSHLNGTNLTFRRITGRTNLS